MTYHWPNQKTVQLSPSLGFGDNILFRFTFQPVTSHSLSVFPPLSLSLFSSTRCELSSEPSDHFLLLLRQGTSSTLNHHHLLNSA